MAGRSGSADRSVLHVDMDAFYAAVEQRDRPELRGQPVVVGADPRGRGVVATASYEARVHGIHSAMPIGRAYRLCPQAVFLPVDMRRYARVSERVMAILGRVTPLVEPVSLDEAFLDVTGSERLLGPAVEIARRIKAEIRAELSLTASAGIGPNKLLAKIASDLRKPDGLVEVAPEQAQAFLAELPVRRLPGVGPAVERVLAEMGLRTVGQLAGTPVSRLRARLGTWGVQLRELALGRDDRPVVPWHDPKSVGAEETFDHDTCDPGRLRAVLLAQAERIAAELRAERLAGRTVTLKLRFADFTTVTRQDSAPTPTSDADEVFRRAWTLLSRLERRQAVRLIGVSVSALGQASAPRQLSLFGVGARAERLGRLTDELRARFGPRAVVRGSLLGLDTRRTGR